MKLIIKTMTGKDLEIDVDLAVSIGELKIEIEKRVKVPAEQQRLVCNGRILMDDKVTLSDLVSSKRMAYSENVIHMVLALRGG
ncbi:hypothetical protein CWI42_120200 [Ordospora colligata]|uniref:Ubiquitin-like domain-containing protein n=1 Tax=Ordospora colligata OC4 TaxID=1354746 RepID=A0A0B2UHL7_9MICR|nr:uncharacterized protein M896_120200 [Ordospora colligata OC4]KHN68803.1 hypothetical protein M896_120200 [Ordospora colligata OC4]TBU13837.1 hypothetical protein CWI40_120200 [Ordospora colligata]TBU14026.1 hypothetical protein CWI41_120200 [Ordospora colligata]TBU17695.1 hypothetical protein CWI42_120200 [Ordospora colligata]